MFCMWHLLCWVSQPNNVAQMIILMLEYMQCTKSWHFHFCKEMVFSLSHAKLLAKRLDNQGNGNMSSKKSNITDLGVKWNRNQVDMRSKNYKYHTVIIACLMHCISRNIDFPYSKLILPLCLTQTFRPHKRPQQSEAWICASYESTMPWDLQEKCLKLL